MFPILSRIYLIYDGIIAFSKNLFIKILLMCMNFVSFKSSNGTNYLVSVKFTLS